MISHLSHHIEPFAHLDPAVWQGHKPSQMAYMAYWTRKWYTPQTSGEFDDTLIRVEVRPRLSQHGGDSQTAVPRR